MKEAAKSVLRQMGVEEQSRSLWHAGKRYSARWRHAELPTLAKQYMASPGAKKLHIGSGGHLLTDWLNVDLEPVGDDVMRLDATREFPFSDSTFDYVYSEHVIEHMPYEGGRSMVAESLRILKPGGVIRICTPDLAALMGLFGPNKSTLQLSFVESHCRDWGAPYVNEIFVMNDYFKKWGHQFIYDEGTLSTLLTAEGFSEVVRCALCASAHEPLQGLEFVARLGPGHLEFSSFTLEATKPA